MTTRRIWDLEDVLACKSVVRCVLFQCVIQVSQPKMITQGLGGISEILELGKHHRNRNYIVRGGGGSEHAYLVWWLRRGRCMDAEGTTKPVVI